MAATFLLMVTSVLLLTPQGTGNKIDLYLEVLKDVAHLIGDGATEGRGEMAAVDVRSGTKGSQSIRSVISSLVGGLQTLSTLPQRSLPSFLTKRRLDSKRLSAFLYNISLYLQNNDLQDLADESLTLSILDPGGVEVDPPPRATVGLKDLFVSLRASRNLDSLIQLLQSILDFFTEQQLFSWFWQKQNWDVIVGLVEMVFQTLLSGTYEQANAGIQELICSLMEQSDCTINIDWLEGLAKLFDLRNWKSAVNFQSPGPPPGTERFRPWNRSPESESHRNPTPQSPNSGKSTSAMHSLLQILSKPGVRRSGSANRSQTTWGEEILWDGLEELKQNILRKVGTSVYTNFKRKVSRMTGTLANEVTSVIGIPQVDRNGKCAVGDLRQLLLWGIRNNITWNIPILGFSSRGTLTETPFLACNRPGEKIRGRRKNSHEVSKRSERSVKDASDFASAGTLEAVCNDSMPRLPGISNFTLYLYCNLFNHTAAVTQTPPDLSVACSDAAWYFSAVEEDLYWVQVCRQFYTSEFNITVCSNSSLLSRKGFNQPWILHLCARLQSGSRKAGASNCDRLSTISKVDPEDISRCLLGNSTDYIHKLCSNETFLKNVVGDKRLIINLCSQLNGLNLEEISVIVDDKNGTDYIQHFCSQMRFLKRLGVSEPWINQVCSWLSTPSEETNIVYDRCDLVFRSSSIEMDEVQECILHLGVEYIRELCSNYTLLRDMTGASDWGSLLCTHTISSLEGLHHSNTDCHGLFEISNVTINDLQECIFGNATAHIHNICTNGTSLKVDERTMSWLTQFCNLLDQFREELDTLIAGNAPLKCDYKSWSYKMFLNGNLLATCKDQDAEGLKEVICRNATLYSIVSQPHPWIVNYCTPSNPPPPDGECLIRHWLDKLPIPLSFNATQLCKNPTAFLMDLLNRFNQCDEQAFSWISNANYILQVFDYILDFSSLGRSEEEVRDVLSEAVLLSSLSDNASFWSSFNPNASISILQTVDSYLKEEANGTLKNDLLNCFSPVLWDMLQSEDDSPALRVLFQEYLQMPQENLRKLLMSAESDTVKKLLSHMHRTWRQLQVGTNCDLLSLQLSQQDEPALETLTAAFLHRFPRVTPDLFVDLSQFIPFMTVSDIRSFPVSLLLNDSVLAAIRDHSPDMKARQKRAFARRLLNSNTFGDVESWPPHFLRSVQPLLPFLPICHFQQLHPEQ
ncbi:putative stereocilin-like protein, partial [Mustelus asterias]